jgi:CRP-like cAMP-binding protein
MSEADFQFLAPHLSLVTLAKAEPLIEPDQPILHCWFMEDGIASVVIETPQGHQAEVGIVGHEGMIDLATVHGQDRAFHRCFIQIPGSGYRLPVAVLKAAIEDRPGVRHRLLNYAYSFITQISSTALANASFSIEERLARWLLLCHDRGQSEVVSMTHEFLSLMLNVRRAGVTTAVQTLERAGLVSGRRGAIEIIDRARLEDFAGDAYIPRGLGSAIPHGN